VDFTNPAAAKEIAYADPAPLVPTLLGGDWSTYWYNGRIYQRTSNGGSAWPPRLIVSRTCRRS
jgi:hypothetical protein